MTNNSYKRKSQYERKVRHNETKLKKTRHASIISIQKNQCFIGTGQAQNRTRE